jgi:hypothetical protein
MERKRAWITSITIGVTFIAATGAVMANAGLLSIGPMNRKVGLLTAADLAPPTAATAPLTTAGATQVAKPIVVVKYQDVYVAAPAGAKTDAAAPVARKKARRPKVGTRSTPQAKPTTKQTVRVQANVKSTGSTDDRYRNEEQQHGEESDD